jgi:hypothetical protein
MQFQDASIRVVLTDVLPPPEGFVYEAWLTEPGADPLSLGVVEVADGQVTVEFTDPGGAPLLALYSGFALSLEPASDPDPDSPLTLAYAGEVAPETVARVRLLLSKSGSGALRAALLDGLPPQVDVYDGHRQLAIDALQGGDLAEGKQHAEHTINILVGELSQDFVDWDGNGRIENPGDGVGLTNYLLLLGEAIAGADGEPDTALDAQLDALQQIAANAEDAAKRIAASDTVEEAQTHIAELVELPLGEAMAALQGQVEGLEMAIRVEVFPVAR